MFSFLLSSQTSLELLRCVEEMVVVKLATCKGSPGSWCEEKKQQCIIMTFCRAANDSNSFLVSTDFSIVTQRVKETLPLSWRRKRLGVKERCSWLSTGQRLRSDFCVPQQTTFLRDKDIE